MTREEFAKHVQAQRPELTGQVSDREWKLIERVYTFHPAISETDGKRQVALLYVEFGIRIFVDMSETAQSMEIIKQEIREAKSRYDELIKKAEQIKKCDMLL